VTDDATALVPAPEALPERTAAPVPDGMAPAAEPVTRAGRYRLESADGGGSIVSISAPNVHLQVEPGLVINRRGLKRFAAQTIFLDGVFSGPPFHDNERRLYSLDHHDGCVRSATLSTCEQAATALLTGLPINEGRWTLLMNEPDLDAILAAWVLTNHIDLRRDDARLLAAVMPLLRAEGNIDVFGFGKEILTGMPAEVLTEQCRRLETLMQPIRELKAAGRWSAEEFVPLVLQELDAIDRLLLPDDRLRELFEYQELGRTRLRGRRIAILCRSAHGIYEVEAYLRDRYGNLLGMVVLDQGQGRFTVRLADGFLPRPLTALFRRLNRRDRNVSSGNGHENAWGGSNDIGGSPRETGSALSAEEVFREVERVLGEPRSWWARLFRRRGP
jgi:hypothetical protein